MTPREIVSQLYDDYGKPFSKRYIRELLYKEGYNLIADVDRQLCECLFGRQTPFRFLPTGEVLEGAEHHILQLTRAVDCFEMLTNQPEVEVRKMLEALKTYSVKDIVSRADEWKSLNKMYRNTDFPLSLQLKLSFCRSLYVRVDENVSIPFLNRYMKDFGNDNPCIPYAQDEIDDQIADEFANFYDFALQKIDKMVHQPEPSKNAASSMSRRKIYDWKNLYSMLDKYEVINSHAKTALLRCIDAMSLIYNLDLSTFRCEVENKSDSVNTTNLIEMLPHGMCVAQRKGKVGRFVCADNDLFDLALNPLMRVIKLMESLLPCYMPNHLSEFSSNGDINKRCADKWKNGLTFKFGSTKVEYSSECCGADSSNATEKFNGHYMIDSWINDYNRLSDESKEKLSLNEEYIYICKQLLTETPFWIFNENSYYIMYTNGTSQGLPVSWDALNYGNMKIIARSFYLLLKEEELDDKTCAVIAQKATFRCLTDGDDAEFPVDIRQHYIEELQKRSLDGVINSDKSHDESTLGYVEFASSYIRTGIKLPNVLSNLMILSLVTDLSDGYKISGYHKSRIMGLQVRMLEPFLKYFETILNHRNLPYYLNDFTKVKKLSDFTRACNIIRYRNLTESLNRIDHQNLIIKEGTDYAPCTELAPCQRALNVSIHNMNLPFDKAYVMSTEKALLQCYDNISSAMGDIDDELGQIYDLMFNQNIPLEDINTDLEYVDDTILRGIMTHVGVRGVGSKINLKREVLEKNYHVQYSGFLESFVISCNLTTIKEI